MKILAAKREFPTKPRCVSQKSQGGHPVTDPPNRRVTRNEGKSHGSPNGSPWGLQLLAAGVVEQDLLRAKVFGHGTGKQAEASVGQFFKREKQTNRGSGKFTTDPSLKVGGFSRGERSQLMGGSAPRLRLTQHGLDLRTEH